MKAIIYAGIALFSVASVYGVADYYKSKKSGELKKLYVEEKQPAPVAAAEEKTLEVIPVKEITPSDIKTVKTKTPKKLIKPEKRLRFENFSRARIPEPVVIEDTLTGKKN